MDQRLNRQAWLDAGLATLGAQGQEGLTIMGIARQLGVTKGSFYWHFADMPSFKAALLEEWERCDTDGLIDFAGWREVDAHERLRELLSATVAGKSPLGRAIRSWSQHDVMAREVQQRVDQKRLAYVGGLLQQLGWGADDAAALARWVYYAVIGYFNMDGPPIDDREMALYLGTLIPPK
ncbi:TetR/AcrR family transcriptional regulator [Rugamonas sp. CCM 8940]|uniref:TetR/AcrR family transcriptional regulator n=1 Tax=Rugamonas sp. CCM 8940 TaxID=2765359 RepID=UPI0018F5D654|nr:TetR/AcrR family transcriptional regulator [Rugamonas sp. CCM 8940]MBJ7311451.1 TetR/AcrR family transcriptional regulator [Rugamonas sp. CCM 8940]